MISKTLEKTILKKVEEIIELVIELSSNIENLKIRDKAIQKTKEITPLLVQYLDGNITLVEPMLHQLLIEKLPDPRIISSFGNLQQMINSIITEAMNVIDNNYKKKVMELDEEKIIADLPINIQTSAIKAFPQANIIFNYRIGGELIDVLILNEDIALITEQKAHKLIKMRYFCEKSGYTLLVIPPNIEGDYRKLLRYLKRNKLLQDN